MPEEPSSTAGGPSTSPGASAEPASAATPSSHATPGAYVAWAFAAERLPTPFSWRMVRVGIERGYCDARFAIANAEAALSTRGDDDLVQLFIETDEYEIARRVASLAASDAVDGAAAERAWWFLCLSWVLAGHGEPGRDPAPSSAPRSEVLESLWVDFGYPAELSFLAYWMPVEPVDISFAGQLYAWLIDPWWSRLRRSGVEPEPWEPRRDRQLAAWLKAIEAELRLDGAAGGA